LFRLSRLFESVGNRAESKRLLVHALKLLREQGDDLWVAHALEALATTNRMLGCYTEGIQQAKEASEIFKQFDNGFGQAQALVSLAWLFFDAEQLADAEEAASQAIDIDLQGDEGQIQASIHHGILGEICAAKGETEKAIGHFETALGIASSFNWHDNQFWIHYSLARLFSDQKRFDQAHAQIERAKSHVANDPYRLGRVTKLDARILFREGKFEEAKFEASCAVDVFGKLGAATDLERCRKFLGLIEEKMKTAVDPGESGSSGSR